LSGGPVKKAEKKKEVENYQLSLSLLYVNSLKGSQVVFTCGIIYILSMKVISIILIICA
jgi:hypothetical protein